MAEELEQVAIEEGRELSFRALTHGGFSAGHAHAIADSVIRAQRDECHSHGLYRVAGCIRAVREGKVDPVAVPVIDDAAPGIVLVDAQSGISLLGFNEGLPRLAEKARRQ